MRFSGAAALFFGGGALALSRSECFTTHGTDIAIRSKCADPGELYPCLFNLHGEKISDIEACYQHAGCSPSDAEREAKDAIQHCEMIAKLDSKVQRRADLHPERTPEASVPQLAKIKATPAVKARDDKLQCLVTETVQTTTCPVSTSGIHLTTLPCVPTQVAKSRCAPGLMCSLDPSGVDVCMKLHNSLDIGGIIISIIFGVAIVIGVSALTFMCCKDRRDQKKLEARAEATALARAQTKKQRAAEVRAPLMRQAGGGGDPFHDRNQS